MKPGYTRVVRMKPDMEDEPDMQDEPGYAECTRV